MLDLLVILGIIVFDIVQSILIKQNHASLSSAFIPLNITLISLVLINLIFIITFIIIKRHKEKNNEFKKD